MGILLQLPYISEAAAVASLLSYFVRDRLRETTVLLLFSSPFALQKVQRYTKIAQDYQAAIDDVLWNEEEEMWLDYDAKNNKHRNAFYVSNLMPLYTMSYDRANRLDYALKAVSYLKRNKIDSFYGKHVPRSISFRSANIDIVRLFFEFDLSIAGTPEAVSSSSTSSRLFKAIAEQSMKRK